MYQHPKIFSDIVEITKIYYGVHENMPRPFRNSFGEGVLQELSAIMRLIVLVNTADKTSIPERSEASKLLREVRARVEVVRGFLMAGWSLKTLSHRHISVLVVRLEGVSKQATKWQAWFDRAN
jgi:hypothetical protein